MKKLLLISLLFIYGHAFTYSQSRIYVNEYLNIGVGGKGLAMAGAQTASSNDVYSAFWNPAGYNNIDS
jgi:hypothetical protein